LVKIWQNYREFKGGNVFETQCTLLYTYITKLFCHIRLFLITSGLENKLGLHDICFSDWYSLFSCVMW